MIFHLRRETAATLYFADLLGASLGALAVTFLLEKFGSETTLSDRRDRAAWRGCASVAAVSRPGDCRSGSRLMRRAFANDRSDCFRVTPGSLKAMRRHMEETPGTHVTQTGWNAYSRIDAVEGFPPPNLARLYIDSDAWTNAQQWDGTDRQHSPRARLVSRFAFPLRAGR